MLGEVYSDISSNIQLLVYMYIHTYVNPAGGRRSRWRRCCATHIIGSSSSPPHTAQKKVCLPQFDMSIWTSHNQGLPEIALCGDRPTNYSYNNNRRQMRGARSRVDWAACQAGLMQVSCGHWPLAFSNRSCLWCRRTKSSGNIVQFVTGVCCIYYNIFPVNCVLR